MLPNMGAGAPAGDARIVRVGGVSPDAVRSLNRGRMVPEVGHNDLAVLCVHKNAVRNACRIVRGPFRTRMGATLPLSVARKTRISCVTGLATNSSSRSTSREMCAGQLSWVSGPWITRKGGVSPPAFSGYTVIEGGRNFPEPGTVSKILFGISHVGAPGRTARDHP